MFFRAFVLDPPSGMSSMCSHPVTGRLLKDKSRNDGIRSSGKGCGRSLRIDEQEGQESLFPVLVTIWSTVHSQSQGKREIRP